MKGNCDLPSGQTDKYTKSHQHNNKTTPRSNKKVKIVHKNGEHTNNNLSWQLDMVKIQTQPFIIS